MAQNIPNPSRKILSPRETQLPHLSHDELTHLPYPPDLYPGARDVSTPWGSTRVYEWGLVTGKKVLLICGGATPSPMLGPIATGLVDSGHRVLIYDLWGRGYTDCPVDLPHDAKLFTAQILSAITTSPIAWTDPESGGFSILGYSLGGGIAMSFAASHDRFVNEVILLAPAGILRDLPTAMKGLKEPRSYDTATLKEIIAPMIGLETSGNSKSEFEQKELAVPVIAMTDASTARDKPDIPAVIRWQYEHHQGFPWGMLSSLLHGPIQYQHKEWKRVAATLRQKDGEKKKSILVIFAKHDPIVKSSEVLPDMEEAFGENDVAEIRTINSDHEFPFTASAEVVSMVRDFIRDRSSIKL